MTITFQRTLCAMAAATAAIGSPAISHAASWTRITNSAPSNVGTMLLLTDGTVVTHSSDSGGNGWQRLTPSASGSYVDGTWSRTAPMGKGRLYFASHVLPNGNLWVLGGEYSDPNLTANWTNTGEVYNTLTDTWTPIADHPESQYGDVPSMLMNKGKILAGSLSGRNTYFYDIASNTWSAPMAKAYDDSSDEETWVKMPDGKVMNYDLFQSINTGGAYAEVFDGKTGSWSGRSPSDGTAAGSIPQLSSSALGAELGAALTLRSRAQLGKVLYIGATGHTATYTVGTNTWAPGPDIMGTMPDGSSVLFGSDDAPAAELPNGHVVLAADSGPTNGTFAGPTQIFDYDPVNSTISPVQPPLPFVISGPAFLARMLMLPTGQALLTQGDNNVWVYTPDGKANAKSQPAVSNVHYDGGGVFTLTGQRLNGISAGSSYGDDAESDENYPIVSFKDGAGEVRYGRTTNWSSTGVHATKVQTVNFTLKSGTPAGVQAMTVSGAGIPSNPVCLQLTADQVAGTGAPADVLQVACKTASAR